MNIAELIILIIFLIPVYGALIYAYIDPEDSYFWARRWMYEEEPELTEDAIEFAKKSSIITIVVITLSIVLAIYRSF